MLFEVVDVAHGDHARQATRVIDEEEFLDLAPAENVLGLIEGRIARPGDEMLAGHHLSDELIARLEEFDVAPREDAHDLAVAAAIRRDGKTRDVKLLHEIKGDRDGLVGVQRDGVGDDAILGSLNLHDLARLILAAQVLVDDADAPLLRQRDGQGGLGDRVHGRTDQGNVDADVAGKVGGSVHARGQDIRTAGDEEHVVERNAVADDLLFHAENTRGEAQSQQRRRPKPVGFRRRLWGLNSTGAC